jgi:hypothetical protein
VRLNRRAAATVLVLLTLLAVVVALYASGPEHIAKHGQPVSILCLDGRMANFVWEPAPLGFCEAKRNGTYRPRSEIVVRTSTWERIYHAVVGSNDTRG